METPDFTKSQAAYLGDLINNKIAPACHYLVQIAQGDEPPRELAGLAVAALASLSAQVDALARAAGIEMWEGKHV